MALTEADTDGTTELTELERVLAEKRAEFEAAQAATQQAVAEANARRQQAHREFDEQLVAKYDEPALAQQVRDAETRLHDAMLADPVWSAVIEVNRARVLRYLTATEAKQAAVRLDRQVPGVTDVMVPVGFAVELAELHRIAELEGARLADEQVSALEDARYQAGEAAAALARPKRTKAS